MLSPAPGTSTWRRGHQISGESVQDTDIISVNERKADTTARRWSCGADLLSKTDTITAFKKKAPGLGSSPNCRKRSSSVEERLLKWSRNILERKFPGASDAQSRTSNTCPDEPLSGKKRVLSHGRVKSDCTRLHLCHAEQDATALLLTAVARASRGRSQIADLPVRNRHTDLVDLLVVGATKKKHASLGQLTPTPSMANPPLIGAYMFVVTPAVIRDPGSSAQTCQPRHGCHWAITQSLRDVFILPGKP